MSTPNPTHIIADHMCSYHGPSNADKVSYCWCGWSGEDHAAHVVSKLTDAGYSIIDRASAEELAAHREDRELDRRWAARCDLNDLRCFDCDLRYGERQDYSCHGSDHSYNAADVARLTAAAEEDQ